MSTPTPGQYAPPPQQTQSSYQTQQQMYQQRYGANTPMSVQSVPSPASVHSPLMQQQQQQYGSMNSQQPLPPPPPPQYSSTNINSPIMNASYTSINSPRPPSVSQQHIYSPMPQTNQQQQQQQQQQLSTSYQSVNSPIMPPSSIPQHNMQSPIMNTTPTSHQIQSPLMSNNSSNAPQATSNYHVNSPIMPPHTPQPQYNYMQQQYSQPHTPINNYQHQQSVNSPYYQQQQSYHSQIDHNPYTPSMHPRSIPPPVSSHTDNSFEMMNTSTSSLNNMPSVEQQEQQQMMLLKQQREQRERELELEREREERERELERQREIERERQRELEQRKRFLVELEFVQCLANPNYLNYLAKQGLFSNDSFKNYLRYLLYWKDPEYVRFIKVS